MYVNLYYICSLLSDFVTGFYVDGNKCDLFQFGGVSYSFSPFNFSFLRTRNLSFGKCVHCKHICFGSLLGLYL